MRTGVEPHFKEIIKLLLKTTHKFLMDSLREEMRKCFDLGIEFLKKFLYGYQRHLGHNFFLRMTCNGRNLLISWNKTSLSTTELDMFIT